MNGVSPDLLTSVLCTIRGGVDMRATLHVLYCVLMCTTMHVLYLKFYNVVSAIILFNFSYKTDVMAYKN